MDKEIAENPDGIPIPRIALSLDLIYEPPEEKDVRFELSCCSCLKDRGPPVWSCEHGHVICNACKVTGIQYCEADLSGGVVCGAEFHAIDDAVRNTPYYKMLMSSIKYNCGQEENGCDAVLSGEKIVQHEYEECVFRYIKYCEFSSTGCEWTFNCLRDNLLHLITVHHLPLHHKSQSRFMVRYDRKEFLKESNYKGVVPVIRAAIRSHDERYLVLVMANDLENGKTRLSFVNFPLMDQTYNLSALLIIHPPENVTFKSANENSIKGELAVVPDIKVMKNLKNRKSKNGERALPYYIDLDNKELDKKYCLEKNGKKYFPLLVLIMEHENEEKDMEEKQEKKEEAKPVENDPVADAILNDEQLKELRSKLEKMMKEYEDLLALPPLDFSKIEHYDLDSERCDKRTEWENQMEDIMDEISYRENQLKEMVSIKLDKGRTSK